ncbi:MAG: gliding motility-associated ABC transporter substrate-binding protein GldG [Paludibacteraceae bacterium]|nr:gliding motility-associated ABC transporter substrate-binding protein GldG [Paludibacteraceae bacterium]MBP6284943.1 gliding motility-associated ABC transporter substrate-binding protein GldG [Paludibacteraceae bacterium]
MKKNVLIAFLILIILNVVSAFYFFRIDLTEEQRYTLSPNTKQLLRGVDDNMAVTLYLAGDLNMGFLRLQKATSEMLQEFSRFSGENIAVQLENPSKASSEKMRFLQYEALEKMGMTPTFVNEKDAEGKFIQKVVFPWAEIMYKGDTIRVNLLKNIPGKLGDENLNVSIESLEYELTDAIRRLVNKNSAGRVAFIEGHGELTELQVSDITNALAQYYHVDRGELVGDVGILDGYKVVIIAGPTEKFTEAEKFILDQYIMNGGRVLWLVDGVRTSIEMLTASATTVGIANEVNIADQLFTYGIRIAPVLVSDKQCAQIRVNVAGIGQAPQFELAPWYYFPLLQTSPHHVITKNLSPIRAEFASAIQFVGENTAVKKELLLASSNVSGIQSAPMQLSLAMINEPLNDDFFQYSFVPIAAILSGNFESVFTNRMPPKEVFTPPYYRIKTKSKVTKMIVVADADIICNDIQLSATDTIPLPLGYDRNMNKQFGNRDFILNAVNYLADDEGWMELRAREFTLRLLDKQSIVSQRVMWQIVNVVFPFVLLLFFVLLYQWSRNRQYGNTRKSSRIRALFTKK